ncbi:MAG: CoA-transferase subunit beta, partial [Nitrospinota bacterium]
MRGYTSQELMTVAGARELRDGELAFIGGGLPVASAMLAQRTGAPNLVIICETGPIGPEILPSPGCISDPKLWHRASRHGTLREALAFLQQGRVDVGFLTGAQVDRYGNLNSTVLAPGTPQEVRFAGSGGANDIASLARRTLIILRHERRRFPERVDYVTSPGFLDGPGARARADLPGKGPSRVITDLGVMDFDPESCAIRLRQLHPGVRAEEVREQTGFDLPA